MLSRRYSREQFVSAVKSSKNIRQALLSLGLNDRGKAYDNFKRAANEFDVDINHLLIKKISICNDEVIAAIRHSHSFHSAIKKLNLPLNTTSNRWIRNKCKRLNLETSHFTGQGHLKGKTHSWNNLIPLNKILIKNSSYNSNESLKKRLLKADLLTYKCYECDIKEWRNKKITLQIDHINGVNNDHRLENLRLLCPNCHSQTPTFAGRNVK